MASTPSSVAGIFRGRTHSRSARRATPGAPGPLQPNPSMRDLLPGGYLFTHLIFWTVVGMVAVGTNAVAIILSVGLGLLLLETVTKQR